MNEEQFNIYWNSPDSRLTKKLGSDISVFFSRSHQYEQFPRVMSILLSEPHDTFSMIVHKVAKRSEWKNKLKSFFSKEEHSRLERTGASFPLNLVSFIHFLVV